MNKYFWLFLFCLANLSVQSQHGFFRNYTAGEGLPSNRVLSLCQDSYGFMWFGTNDGLSRFDGHRFKNYFNTPNDSLSIASNNIFYLAKDPEGLIWLGYYENGIDIDLTLAQERLSPILMKPMV